MIQRKISEVLEAMLPAIKRGVSVANAHDRERLEAYTTWLEETLANFSDDLDSMSPPKGAWRQVPPIAWVNNSGRRFEFLPSRALLELGGVAHRAGLPRGIHMQLMKWALTYGHELNRSLKAVPVLRSLALAA